ncbi:DegV family protein [Solimonas sp. SE-A11]|uniref:DegV family protein n=1 Tax=Solimonas sp. SE-A11 TaxID=3054954 RepID=UPI00259CCCB4|nr:DegV family protein [Solimonas sp. SE-A11]MDM4769541.1 DegV family protein [Solimonas sp. SE-A11]
MRTGIVVDASCDLPPRFLVEHNIQVLPSSIHIGAERHSDAREPKATLDFYTGRIGRRSLQARTESYPVGRIRNFFLDRLVSDFDHVICIPIWKERSPLHGKITEASLGILSNYREYRADAAARAPFSMRVLDSGTLFAGLGVQAAECAAKVQEGRTYLDILAHLGEVSRHTVSCLVPEDVAYVRERSRQRGESVGSLLHVAGQALGIKPVVALHEGRMRMVASRRGWESAANYLLRSVARVVEEGWLASRFVCASYGGEPERMEELAGFRDLRAACEARGVKLLLSIMSAVAAVNVGAGALSVAYSGEMAWD